MIGHPFLSAPKYFTPPHSISVDRSLGQTEQDLKQNPTRPEVWDKTQQDPKPRHTPDKPIFLGFYLSFPGKITPY